LRKLIAALFQAHPPAAIVLQLRQSLRATQRPAHFAMVVDWYSAACYPERTGGGNALQEVPAIIWKSVCGFPLQALIA
jgi:hypothetical protein